MLMTMDERALFSTSGASGASAVSNSVFVVFDSKFNINVIICSISYNINVSQK